VGTYSTIWDQRYWTELDIRTSDFGLKRAQSDILPIYGINFIWYTISDNRLVINSTVAEGYCTHLVTEWSWVRILQVWTNIFFSEGQFSVWHIFFRCRNNRCRCQRSDIADIMIDVDAHLCALMGIVNSKFNKIIFKKLTQNWKHQLLQRPRPLTFKSVNFLKSW
jgi:hypothetical protein